ncbi:MAG: hypothetical protein AB7F35_13775 [Acetobacteraceae bacterium]
MMIVIAIAEWSVVAFGLLLLAFQLIAQEFGFWVGKKHRTRGQAASEGVNVVVGGMLALLAFVLALTLSFANNRYSERRMGTLQETNAIGTAWLRASAIDHPRSSAIAHLLEDYTRVRQEFVQAGRDPASLDDINQRTNNLQSQIWGHLTALLREQPNVVTTNLMASLNDVFDMTTAERFAYDLRLPPQIFWLLIGMTMLSMAALGYQLGLRDHSVRMLVLLLTTMWTVVIVDTLDLAAARIGTFRASTSVYDWTLDGFSGGVTIPPLPNRP